ncbi:MAG: hypothetical protein AAB316_13875, partial [Bacteroidota bacterium]
MKRKNSSRFFSAAPDPGLLHTPRAWAGFFFFLVLSILSFASFISAQTSPPYDATKPSHDILYTDTIDAKTAQQIEIAKSINIIGNTNVAGKLGVGVRSISEEATVDVDGNVKAAGFTIGATTITNWDDVGGFKRVNRVAYTDDNVGIGVQVPTEKLEVAGNVKAENFLIGGSSLLDVVETWKKSGANLHYENGNIGIGTSTPSQKLTVLGQTYLSRTNTETFEDGNVPDATLILRESASGGKQASIGFLNENAEGLARFAAGPNSGAGITGELGLSAPRFIFGSPIPNVKVAGEFTGDLFVGGNLGIGTTSPKTRLHFS